MKLRLERFERAFKEFYEDSNITPEELTNYLNNEANFRPSVWSQLEELRMDLDQKLNQELQNIRNPFETSQNYAERGEIQRHWLFVG